MDNKLKIIFHLIKKNWTFYIFLISLIFLVYYFFWVYPYYFQSDDASRVLQAQEMIKDHKIFSPQWNNVNNDLLILSSHFYVLPFLFFLKPGYQSYAIGGTFSALIMLFSVWLMLREINTEKRIIYLVLAILTSGISPLNAQITFGQYSYGNFLTFSCLIIFFCYKFLRDDHFSIIKCIPIGVMFFLVFWSNPIRAIPTYLAPLLLTALIFFTTTFKTQGRANAGKFLLIIFIACIGSICGGLAHKLSLQQVSMIGLPSNLVWVDFNSFITNIVNLINSVIEIFGGWPTTGSKILSIKSIVDFLHVINAIIFLIIFGWIFKNIKSNFYKKESFLIIFSASSFLIMSFLVASSGMIGHRYISNSLLMVIIALFCFNVTANQKRFSKFMVLYALLLIIMGVYGLTLKEFKYSAKIGVTWNNQQDNLANFLESNNLKYGYATYWRANKISVISGGRVLVRAIDDMSKPKPYRWLSSNNWYEPDIFVGETFLLATKEESKRVDWDYFNSNCGPALKVLDYEEYFIYVFPKNIAQCLPEWLLRND